MPGCAAINCSNSAKKGFLMKHFPKDPLRRQQWLIKMKRDNWKPTDYSCLCEVHFAPEMWEKTRVDGKRPLKSNAVPTLFSFTQPAKVRKSSKIRKPISPEEPDILHSDDMSSEIPDKIHVDVNSLSTSLTSIANVDINIQSTDLDKSGDNSMSNVDENPSTSQFHKSGDKSRTNEDENNPSTSPVDLNTSSSSQTTSDDTPIPDLTLDSSNKLKKLEKMYLREKLKARKYKKLLRNSTKKYNLLKKKLDGASREETTFFNPDQQSALEKKRSGKSTKLMKWSKHTVVKSLKLKFSCGNNGYIELLKQGYPLPSLRTLQRRLQNLKFDSGILHEVFEFLDLKVQSFSEKDRYCVLVLDEMSITPGRTYDVSLSKYFGDITLPEHDGMATHVLVFMLGGVATHWKQVVGYYFTGDSVNGAVFDGIIKNIFEKCEEINLKIVSITSDMGPCNQTLWRSWGVGAGKHVPVKCSITHPTDQNKKVFILADVPHLFKNIKSMLMINKVIELPDFFVEKYNLPTNTVLSSHIHELVKYEENNLFKLAPKLTEEDLLPTHFAKMKVSTSTNVISHSVSSALKFLAEELGKPEYTTTAFFLDQVEKWFYLMTSRHPSSALSKFDNNKYQETVSFLKEIKQLFSTIKVGVKQIWKPCQSGVLISTESMLNLQSVFLNEKGFEFLLTSRFSQDCLENLFCVLRSKQIVPNAVQVKNNLKIICVSQYLKSASYSSYSEDDREFLSDFIDVLDVKEPHQYEDVKLPVKSDKKIFNLSVSELNSLYNICGYILKSIKNTTKTCATCLNAVGSQTPIYKRFTKFSILKRFKESSLFFVSEVAFYFFIDMENIFRKYFDDMSKQNVNLKEFYFKEMANLKFDIPNCHNLKEKMIKRFITFRLKINSKRKKSKSNKHSSKSVAGNLL